MVPLHPWSLLTQKKYEPPSKVVFIRNVNVSLFFFIVILSHTWIPCLPKPFIEEKLDPMDLVLNDGVKIGSLFVCSC